MTRTRSLNFPFGLIFLLLFGAIAVSTPRGRASRQVAAPARHVNSDRLQGTLEKLSEFGRNPEGGVTRQGFSETDMAAREYVMGLMRDARLDVRVDPAGNIFGHRAGSERLPVILFGSHIDSVLHGGNFDGDVGSMGAIEVIRALNEHKIVTRHPLEIVIWTNEEGNHFGLGTFGSAAAAGLLNPDVLQRKDEQGLTLADWLRRYGQDPANFLSAKIPASSLAGYVELHIEQGGVLDAQSIPIGIVQGIVGIKRRNCVVTGFANHAGTTPMDHRQDALAAAAREALAVREETRRTPGRQVGTVGVIKAEPGAPNVVPGRVEFTIDMRDLKSDTIDTIWARTEKRFAEIDKEEKVTTHCTLVDKVEPAETDAAFKSAIREAAAAAGLATRELPSGAGHDAQEIARIAPIGMIFVPSRGGISHSPREFSTWPHIAGGAEVLYRTILLLDARLNHN
jgi:N-carbamoyl-L-amino-acid hydrolase